MAFNLAHMFFSISIRKEDRKQHLEWTTDYIQNLESRTALSLVSSITI